MYVSLGVKDASFVSVTESIGIDSLYTLIKDTIISGGIEGTEKIIIMTRNNINIIQELIRESIINRTNKELPYETAVHMYQTIRNRLGVTLLKQI
ncbi:MAG: hypothetical protein ACJ0QV_05835 [Gammaproteobacteria bacterium]